MERIEAVVVGAGQAGLVMSRLLAETGVEHVVLDRRASLGGGWQDRWDAFRLVSPNWTVGVPGYDYQGTDPDGFMTRDELIAHFRAYADVIHAPVRLATEVTRLVPLEAVGETRSSDDRFELETSDGRLRARHVVVAAGPFQVPHIPRLAEGLAPSILSLHSHDYRRPDLLPPGGVLLVGSGQTGVQLAEELQEAGRAVTIAVGHCGSVPRRYRDRDIFWWLRQLRTRGPAVGVELPQAAALPSPAARFQCNPQLSGHGGGHDISLRRMAAGGIRLAGRLEALDGTRARFRADLNDNLAFADGLFEQRFRAALDDFAARAGEDLPPGDVDHFAFDVPELTELDLAADGIGTVLWTSGYRPAFGWIEAPVLDEFDLPIQEAGMTTVPGLAFIGTPWLRDMGSANLVGVAADAEALLPRLVAS